MASLLHTHQIHPRTSLNRLHFLLYSLSLLLLLHHHTTIPSTFLLFLADVFFAFMWLLSQGYRWRPVRRREFPDRLSQVTSSKNFPALDVFVCTADPSNEPPVGVASTALSALAFDYPSDRLSVYVSDDGGSDLTLFAFFEAAKFARCWLPFCRENGVMERSPEAYFQSGGCDGEAEEMKVLLESKKEKDITGHPLLNLIYISREKRPASPHDFKARALNALVFIEEEVNQSDTSSNIDVYKKDGEYKTLNLAGKEKNPTSNAKRANAKSFMEAIASPSAQ